MSKKKTNKLKLKRRMMAEINPRAISFEFPISKDVSQRKNMVVSVQRTYLVIRFHPG